MKSTLRSNPYQRVRIQDVRDFENEITAKVEESGRYIVEFEQGGNHRAKYGDQLLVKLSKDLTRTNGRGFSRSNLTYMRKFYVAFPKCETISHKLTWREQKLNMVMWDR